MPVIIPENILSVAVSSSGSLLGRLTELKRQNRTSMVIEPLLTNSMPKLLKTLNHQRDVFFKR